MPLWDAGCPGVIIGNANLLKYLPRQTFAVSRSILLSVNLLFLLCSNTTKGISRLNSLSGGLLLGQMATKRTNYPDERLVTGDYGDRIVVREKQMVENRIRMGKRFAAEQRE